jgi:multiple sugar transport system permease protein
VAKAGRARKLVDRAVLYATVTAFAACWRFPSTFPFYWMLLATFKTDHDLYDLQNNPLIFNNHPTLANLKLLFDKTLYFTWVWNTVIVGALVVVIALALALPAGYALARLTGKWGERRDIAIFLSYLVPSTCSSSRCPASWRPSAYKTPCGRWSWSIRRVIFAFTLTIQEFTYALTFITSSGPQTVGVATNLVRGDVYFWGSLKAACLITSIPVAILYNLFVDRFISSPWARSSSGTKASEEWTSGALLARHPAAT